MAAESLSPSPANNTLRPLACSCWINACLSVGVRRDRRVRAGIAAARSGESPVARTMSMPNASSDRIAGLNSGTCFSSNSIVAASAPSTFTMSAPSSAEPANSSRPSANFATIPSPGNNRTDSRRATVTSTPAHSGAKIRLNGCRLASSASLRKPLSSVDDHGGLTCQETPYSSGSVSVPVLSNTTVSISDSFSTASPERAITPSSRRRAMPVHTARGVANPRAQGQAITATDSAINTA